MQSRNQREGKYIGFGKARFWNGEDGASRYRKHVRSRENIAGPYALCARIILGRRFWRKHIAPKIKPGRIADWD